MKLLFDFFPVLLFFIAFKLYGVFVATAVAMTAAFVQVGLFWAKHRRFETLHLITLVLIAVLGGATLLWQDETFIKWKPTAVNWLFALVFVGSHVVGDKTFAERLMGASITLSKTVWVRLNLSWVAFFFALGCANLYVAYHFDTDTWVNFKLFGMLGLTVAFVIAQAFYLARYVKPDTASHEKS